MYSPPPQLQNNFHIALTGGIFNWMLACDNFCVGASRVHDTNIGGRWIHIESRPQMDKSILWVVKMEHWVLGKDGEYHYEPLPSSRTDDFIKNTRFDSKEEALEALIKYENENKAKEPQLTIPRER